MYKVINSHQLFLNMVHPDSNQEIREQAEYKDANSSKKVDSKLVK